MITVLLIVHGLLAVTRLGAITHQAMSVALWKTKASRRSLFSSGGASGHRPTRPSDGSINPATRRSSVLLPQPDGPMRVRNSPSAMVRSIGASARVPFGKIFSAKAPRQLQFALRLTF